MSDRTGNGSKTIRRYDVRGNVHGHAEWIGTFVISDDGYFSTVSGWGNYAFYWSHAGQCFRSFLASIDTDYLLHKISRANEYDGEATGNAVRRHILTSRREGSMDREDARREWDLFLDNERLESREHFAWWYTDTRISDASEFAEHDFPSEAKHFANLAWPHFVAALRAELDAERTAPAVEVAP